MTLHLEHAFITGAAGAIGGAIAEALRRALPHDATLSLTDLPSDQLNERARALGASAHPCDLTRLSELPETLRAAEGAAGRPVDLLVNCAGVMDVRSIEGMPWEAAARVLEVDLIAPLRLMSLVAPGMAERGSGAIINVSSMAGITPLRGCAYYGAAKAGLAMASEIAAMELEPRGVHVLTVYPGPVESPLEAGARAQLPASPITRAIPMGRPEPLAQHIITALQKKRRRVVYPAFFELAARLPGLASRITRWLSPEPRA